MTLSTTRRSIVLALASDDVSERARAFDTLVAIYWKPLYKYVRVAHGHDASAAEQETQSFLASAFGKNSLAAYDAEKASFRTFLRLLFDTHIANGRKALPRLKPGGGAAHLDFTAAEAEIVREHDRDDFFRREWVRSIFELAVERLRESSRAGDFVLFEAYDLDDIARASYGELAARFDLSESVVTNRLAAIRRQFRLVVLEVLREATASDHEFREEARALLGVEL
jgi:DNA-directed RNA polymerase specialized sigma24 family protein